MSCLIDSLDSMQGLFKLDLDYFLLTCIPKFQSGNIESSVFQVVDTDDPVATPSL